MLTRMTDGGQSWDAPRTIYDPGNNQEATGNQVVVSPNGILTDFFNVLKHDSGKKETMTLSLVQSSDMRYAVEPGGSGLRGDGAMGEAEAARG